MKTMVFTCYLAPPEEDAFLSYLDTTGDVVAYSVEWKESPLEVRAHDLRSFINKFDPPKIFIGIKSPTISIDEHDFSGVIRYNVTAEKSALISYRRARLNDGRLGRTNLAAYYDVSSRPIEIDRAFRDWSRKVFNWVRKRTPELDKSGNYPMSLEVNRGLRDGDYILGI